MSPGELLITALLALGVFFYAAGTVGLIRFPDTHSRLHALTKADNLGLGFIVLAAGLHWGDAWIAGKLALIWLLALFAAGMAAQLVARAALKPEPRE
ncbi:monovalent cation/H(+) antiporter subunit G [Alkalicaulis satelles]|uniref:Monovalent cation/H(+) antiporter subunit G n=1 Tax=Alkalicaulis satelles TaxID=2609175 RepID=A0A5M6ZCL7_9PROT|nr:monovalent cation/H(+) antiporter subunit G [Alkalicaulis satelles]KAA5801644.1 monovalent cation/H(+) antiporter subunit G [Alkalicaulis satelles]